MTENNTEALESSDSSLTLIKAGFFSRLALNCLFFAIIFVLPSGILAWFDGLPWAGELETIVLAVITPLLLILGWRFLLLRWPTYLLSALLVLKIILFVGSPSSGWLVKVYPNLNQELSEKIYPFKNSDGKTWVRTYATAWYSDSSGVLQDPWLDQLDFPLDWAMFNFGCPPPWHCFDQLALTVETEGDLLLPEGNTFALVVQGVQKGTLSAVHESGESLILPLAKNLKEASEKHYQLPQSGRWRVSGKFKFSGTEWSLIPVLVKADGETSVNLGRDVLWQSSEELLSSTDQIGVYKIVSIFLDTGILVFIFMWTVWSCRLLMIEQVLNIPLVVASVSAIGISIFMAPVFKAMLAKLGSPDPTTASYLGFSVVIVSMIFLVWVFWKKDFRSFSSEKILRSILLFFGPAILVFFSNKWWSILGKWSNWGGGDDWSSYQHYARKIVVEGEWLNGGHGIFTMQPLYRYFVGVYHWLFGQSAFVQHMADVWCVIGATILLSSWAKKIKVSSHIIFIASSLYLAATLIGAFRYHIGRGLIEYHAMFFMILAGWILYSARDGSFMKIVLAGVSGVIGYWLRQDHVIAITMLAFLIIEPTYGTTREVWRSYWEQILTHWKRGFSYVGIIAFGVFLICFRNWWVGGVFGPSSSHAVNLMHDEFDLYTYYLRIKLMVTASNVSPTISTLVMLPGVLFGLLSLIWRPKILQSFPMAIGWVFIGIFLPYVFFSNPGYAPRYSIHLLPMTFLSMMIVIDCFYKKLFSKSYENF